MTEDLSEDLPAAVIEEVPGQWSTEAVAESFRAEIRARFEAHNAAYRAQDAVELEQALREHPEYRGEPGFTVRDSFAWEVYQACEIRIESNLAIVVMPIGYGFRTDLLPLFDHTTVAWAGPIIGAIVVDGEPRPTIEILLVATWTDEMDAKWRADGNARRRVEVELYEDEVHAIVEAVDAGALAVDERGKLRERLLIALEPIP